MLQKTSSIAVTLLYLYCCISPSSEEPTGVLCPPVNGASGCVCKSPAGIIDLSSLGSTDGVPRFSGLSDPNSWLYDFNPCHTFTTEGECNNVYVCQTGSSDNTKYAIANAGQEGIYIDGEKTYIYFTGPGERQTKVELICDPKRDDPLVTTLGDSVSFKVYQFTLTSKFACPGGGAGVSAGIAAGIAGLVLMLLLLAGVATYFIVGGVILKVRCEKTGTDLIINKIFWFALPGLIKEGCIFTFGPCFIAIRGLVKKNQGYEEDL